VSPTRTQVHRLTPFAKVDGLRVFYPPIPLLELQQSLMRDTTLAGSDCLLQKIRCGFLFLWEPGVDAINKHVRVNELCHARRDHLDASRVGQPWLDVENPVRLRGEIL
jgi:hypothetical protein